LRGKNFYWRIKREFRARFISGERICCNFVVQPMGGSIIVNLTRCSEQAENEAVQ
jgi:hypothetical protein